MFPEGDPASMATQEILFWQFRTMETMYKRIAQAIQVCELGTHPTDYLSFFCLAKRESIGKRIFWFKILPLDGAHLEL